MLKEAMLSSVAMTMAKVYMLQVANKFLHHSLIRRIDKLLSGTSGAHRYNNHIAC